MHGWHNDAGVDEDVDVLDVLGGDEWFSFVFVHHHAVTLAAVKFVWHSHSVSCSRT